MPAAMSKRERVHRTLAGQETDQVPLYDLLRNDAAFAHFSGQALPPLAGDEATLTRLNQLAGQAVGAFLDMTRSVGFGPAVECETTDEFGFVHHHAPFEKTSWISRRPFDDEAGATRFLQQWVVRMQEQARAIDANPAAHRERYHHAFLQTNSRTLENLLAMCQVAHEAR